MVKIVDTILSQEVDRREFLTKAGAVALTLAGVGGIIRAMTSSQAGPRVHGYGSTPYGGKHKSSSSPVPTSKDL